MSSETFNFSSPVPLDSLNTKARRNLSRKNLLNHYTKEEVDALIKTYEYEVKSYHELSLANLRWSARFEELKSNKLNLLRKWTPHEDEFLRSTYMYLSDATIALALNIPSNIVLSRRKVLKLAKTSNFEIDVIIWCERDSFEDDMNSKHLLKARPDVIL